MAEMTEGLFEDGHNPEEEGKDDGDDDVLPSAPVVAERRKTRKQRNKEKQISQQVKSKNTILLFIL